MNIHERFRFCFCIERAYMEIDRKRATHHDSMSEMNPSPIILDDVCAR